MADLEKRDPATATPGDEIPGDVWTTWQGRQVNLIFSLVPGPNRLGARVELVDLRVFGGAITKTFLRGLPIEEWNRKYRPSQERLLLHYVESAEWLTAAQRRDAMQTLERAGLTTPAPKSGRRVSGEDELDEVARIYLSKQMHSDGVEAVMKRLHMSERTAYRRIAAAKPRIDALTKLGLSESGTSRRSAKQPPKAKTKPKTKTTRKGTKR